MSRPSGSKSFKSALSRTTRTVKSGSKSFKEASKKGLGMGAGKATDPVERARQIKMRAASVEQSDREYIAQKQKKLKK